MWVVSFTPRPLYLRKRAPGTHWIGGWVSPRAGLDDVEKRNFLPHRDSNSDPSVVQPVASRYIDYAVPDKWYDASLMMNWKEFRRMRSWPKGVREMNISKDIGCPGRDSTHATPEYKSRAVLLRLSARYHTAVLPFHLLASSLHPAVPRYHQFVKRRSKTNVTASTCPVLKQLLRDRILDVPTGYATAASFCSVTELRNDFKWRNP
jgi:hypothetical protein